ncbi:unnamed protein product [Nippostrongylus brasiliensis]|uniref:SCP domain-containing protein n=1 Tax=Nippostrongylus brasiliensis TaxID=27835 RepID=A0A0N4YMF2_NIPBR|nr:unnamed protein product [Nippostrongylus brasiliensis]
MRDGRDVSVRRVCVPWSRRDSGVNQICPGNANMNDRIREKALMMHNYRRSLLANGQVAKNNGNYLPAGANMIQLKYDCNLEKTAKAHADTCSFGYSSAASTVSENIARIPKTATVVNRINATSEAVKSWWKNVRTQSVNIGMQVTFKQKHVGQPIEAFIKMAWANTRNIGCGGKLCGNDFFIVCQYTPKGAIAGQVVYQKGNPCSACPAATYCSSPLCVVP